MTPPRKTLDQQLTQLDKEIKQLQKEIKQIEQQNKPNRPVSDKPKKKKTTPKIISGLPTLPESL
jgi:transposase